MENQPQSDRLSQLRALAQQHLTEIEVDKAQEAAQLTQAEAEIQRYSKLPSIDHRRKHVSNTSSKPLSQSQPQPQADEQGPQPATDSPVELNKPRLRPFQEILHRLRWDSKFNIDEYVVGYLERFEGIKEMPASNWIRDFSDEDWIPMHRVRYVKRIKVSGDDQKEGPELGLVWDRDGRIDKISTANNDESEEVDNRTDVLSIDGTSVTGGVPL
ncbi:hypothetical protein PMZ80_003031 [Knufia obscura]|uniref:MJ1316 RNA cyclic group end recognition domain-containing protein n=2 Tax=Knufia TaxID=430999 RepID=A0AAN8ERU9_9EURO|nr:hypothetical protein PMZ80_003031 [Knufia obscura]KAK5952381.1 hypothetical protein OHC33_006424 [Knufia fluminis]